MTTPSPVSSIFSTVPEASPSSSAASSRYISYTITVTNDTPRFRIKFETANDSSTAQPLPEANYTKTAIPSSSSVTTEYWLNHENSFHSITVFTSRKNLDQSNSEEPVPSLCVRYTITVLKNTSPFTVEFDPSNLSPKVEGGPHISEIPHASTAYKVKKTWLNTLQLSHPIVISGSSSHGLSFAPPTGPSPLALPDSLLPDPPILQTTHRHPHELPSAPSASHSSLSFTEASSSSSSSSAFNSASSNMSIAPSLSSAFSTYRHPHDPLPSAASASHSSLSFTEASSSSSSSSAFSLASSGMSIAPSLSSAFPTHRHPHEPLPSAVSTSHSSSLFTEAPSSSSSSSAFSLASSNMSERFSSAFPTHRHPHERDTDSLPPPAAALATDDEQVANSDVDEDIPFHSSSHSSSSLSSSSSASLSSSQSMHNEEQYLTFWVCVPPRLPSDLPPRSRQRSSESSSTGLCQLDSSPFHYPPSHNIPRAASSSSLSSSSSSSSLLPPSFPNLSVSSSSRKRLRRIIEVEPGANQNDLVLAADRLYGALQNNTGTVQITDDELSIHLEMGPVEASRLAMEIQEIGDSLPSAKRRRLEEPIYATIDPSLSPEDNDRLANFMQYSDAPLLEEIPEERFQRPDDASLPKGFCLREVRIRGNQKEVVFLNRSQPPIPKGQIVSFCLGNLTLATKSQITDCGDFEYWDLSSKNSEEDEAQPVIKYARNKDPFTTKVGTTSIPNEGNLCFEVVKVEINGKVTLQIAYKSTKTIHPGDPLVLEMEDGGSITLQAYKKNIVHDRDEIDEKEQLSADISEADEASNYDSFRLIQSDKTFPHSRSFPLVPDALPRKKYSNLLSAKKPENIILKTVIGLFENTCIELGTNYQSVGREVLLKKFYENCKYYLEHTPLVNNDSKFKDAFKESFAKVVRIVRSDDDDVSKLKVSDRNYQANQKRFSQIVESFDQSFGKGNEIRDLLDKVYTRNPDWDTFIEGVFNLLKEYNIPKKQFEEIFSLISKSKTLSKMRQKYIPFTSIPNQEIFNNKFTYSNYLNWKETHS